MSNILAGLHTAGNALHVYQRGLDVVQNNIINSTTAGYAKQSLNLEAQAFELTAGLTGGVAARGLSSTRDEYAEEEVRRQAQSLGRFEIQARRVAEIENQFDVSGDSGLSADLNALFQSFSAWSVSPSSVGARQSVISMAGNLAGSIRRLAGSLARISRDIEGEISDTVDSVNQLAASIEQYNVERLRQVEPDPNMEAGLHADLEQLAELVDVTAVAQSDGTFSVLLNNGSPLVIGENQYLLSAALATPGGVLNPQGPPSSQILDWQGNDVTGSLDGGKLGGLLDVHNRFLASLLGDGQQDGSINRFAKSLADTVNGILESGTVSANAGAASGSPLFTYDAADATRAAGSFALNADLTPEGLAPVDSAGNSNGNALRLVSLANSSAAGGVGGVAFGDFFSQVAAGVGRESAHAGGNEQTQRQVVAQTGALRDQISGVSLDEQAVMLLQFQKSYQAVARYLTALNDIAETTINILR